MADSGSSSSDVTDNPAGYSDPQQAPSSNGAAGPNKGQLAENSRHIEQRAEQQEALDSGDGFQFDPDELRELRDEWQDLAEELNDLRMRTRELGNAGPPAEEEASRGQIKAVYQHAKVCAEIHDQMYEYAHQYKQRLDEALAKLQESDQDAQETVHNTGKGL